MKLVSKIAAVALGLSAFSAAQAEGLYAGANFSSIDADGPSFTGIGGHVGAKLNPNLAVEGRFGIGMGDDNGWELDNYASVLAKGIYPIQENLSAYGLVGFSRVAWSYSWEHTEVVPVVPVFDPADPWGFLDADWGAEEVTSSLSASGTETGLSLGGGVEYALSQQISLTAEYLMMTSDFSSLTAGVSYKF